MSRIHLTIEDVVNYFNGQSVKQYQKTAAVSARRAVPGEVVVTVVGDGEPETTNTAKENQVVIRNDATPYKEEQIAKLSKFQQLYQNSESLSDNWQTFQPNPETPRFAVVYTGQPATFTASWGEDMLLNDGDYLQSLNVERNVETFDIYRVDKAIFESTFTEVVPETNSAAA